MIRVSVHGSRETLAALADSEDGVVKRLGHDLLLARRLIEAGVRLVSVVAWCGLAPGDKFLSVETWDMHGNAGGIGSVGMAPENFAKKS